MKIACLQFAPQVGDVDNNLNRADSILNRSNPGELDLLVLPELAFSGYNFKSLHTISPFLEPTGSGITSVWARTTALKHNCKVVVGYPETADVSYKWPTSPEYYNSAIVVNEDGDTCGHYRKSHLYYTDETWALEGTGFFKRQIDGIGKVAMGICMDINPYKFEAPWNVYEFARHVLDVSAKVVILSMAWLTREDGVSFSCRPKEPDMETLTYWITRLEPLIRCENEEEIIVIFANRTGIEDDAVYAGTSAVIGIKNGEVTVYGLLGRGEKELLVVDTDKPGFAKLVYRPDDEEQESVDALGSGPDQPPSREDDRSGIASGSLPDGGRGQNRPYANSEASKNPSEVNRRSFGGHVLVDSDAIPDSAPSLPEPTYDQSPISPRYYVSQSPLGAPPAAQLPNTGIHSSYEEWRDSLKADDDDVEYSSSRNSTNAKQADVGSTDEFLSLVNTLHDPAPAAQRSIDRPFSTKSRNASRNGFSTSKENKQAEKLDKQYWQGSDDHLCQYPDEASNKRSGRLAPRNENTGQARPIPQSSRGASPEERHNTMSPDLEKIGADLMVFEEGETHHPKRDSLVCHVDEDDYVVLRAERKDATGRKNPGKHDERNGRSGSRHSPRPLESLGHHGGRSRTNSRATVEPPAKSVEKQYTRQSSRGRRHDEDVSKPRSLSKKASRGWIATGTTSPPVRQLSREAKHRHKHQGSGLSGMESLPFRSHKYDAPVPSSSPRKHQVHETVSEQKYQLPTRSGKQPERESNGMPAKITLPLSDFPMVFSPETLGYSPNIDAAYVATVETPETGLTIPDRFLERPLPTPKAMVLPRDYDIGANGHQSAPIPPRNQAPAAPLKCLDEANGVQAERPRSAVW